MRSFPQPSVPQTSPNRNSNAILKRKESPTKPEKPSRKKAAIDPTTRSSSPIALEASPEPVKNHDAKAILKRKESPTKPVKPTRKKAAIDPSTRPSSPIEAAPNPLKKKPPSTKLKSTNKAARPTVKIPPAPVPETIDLSMSPIEEADFSVLVSRFEPEATSTQPKKLTAAPSKFVEMMERVEKQSAVKRERKLSKVPKPGAKSAAGPSKAGPSNHIAGDDSSIISVSSSPSRPSSPQPQPNAIVPIKATRKSKLKPGDRPKQSAPAKKGKKEKIKMFPKDYAQMLIDQLAAPPDPAGKPRVEKRDQFLKGKNIFYTGGDYTTASDRTMGRMDLVVKYGGNLFPVFDGKLVTHIILSETTTPVVMLRALGLKKMKEIPAHIPILRWAWVAAGMDGSDPGPLFEYAAFSSRIPEVEYPAKGKGKQRALPEGSANLSRISDFTQDKKQPRRTIHDSEDDEPGENAGHRSDAPISPTSPPTRTVDVGKASSSRVKSESNNADDPLAEFYEQAKAWRDDNSGTRHGEVVDQDETDVEDIDDEVPHNPGPAPRRGFTCDHKEVQRRNGPNEFIAKKLEELLEFHRAKPGDDNHWRVLNYTKAARALRNHPTRIKSAKEARLLRGVGEKTALKIMEIIDTGDLRRIKYENSDDVKVRKIFQGIYGVGQTTAYQWYSAGCRTLDDLKAGKFGVVLTPAQKIGIQFYDDINDRMPREEAKALFDIIKPIALSIDPKLEIQVMGSYRRGKADCGDIDIMITRCPDDGKTHAGILHHLLKALHERKIITEDLALPDNPFHDEAIYRGLCRLPQFGSRRRRIDFLTIPYKSRGAALIYYTGDDIFNRAMRLKANKLNYSLNQRGLFEGVVRDPKDRTKKLNKGNLVASETEEEIFKILDVPFQEPHERVRG
ncbi:DNA polymerase lambda [Mycena latifolia]|nr:DNA polymerase lambda [Mycena latifolia]